MSFLDINFPNSYEYSSDTEHPPVEFYLQTLPKSKSIFLKLGYFSSSAIRLLGYGFASFIHQGGCLKIITNHYLYQSDKELIDVQDSPALYSKNLLNDFIWLKDALTGEAKHFFDCLKFLVKEGRVEIIPVMLLPDKMSHYKQGVFIDDCDNAIFIDGSCNFSAQGLVGNGENISVFRSWGSDFEQVKVQDKFQDISTIVSRKSDKYLYLKPEQVSDAFYSIGEEKSLRELIEDEVKLISKLKNDRSHVILENYHVVLNSMEDMNVQTARLRIPNWLNYRVGDYSHQGDAIDAWFENNQHGTLEIATGGGKTLTSLVCAALALETEKAALLIIAVPTKPLLKQWAIDVSNFSVSPIDTEGLGTQNIIKKIRMLGKKHQHLPEHSVILMTHDALKNRGIQTVLSKYEFPIMLIGDEAHNLGSRSFVDEPPTFIEKRLALSATPDRQYDAEGTEKLLEFFGPVVYIFSLENAIGNCLVPFEYHVKRVYLDEDEAEKWLELTEKINNLCWSDDPETKSIVERLRIRRRAISESVKNKIYVFSQEFSKLSDKKFSLVFCTDKNPSQLKDVNEVLKSAGCIYHQITAEESSDKNLMRDLVKSYKEGSIEVLTSKRVLDEGFNIPPIKTAFFLASSGTLRTWVQRLGRVLRKSEETGKDKAIVYDLVVIPPEGSGFKALIDSELIRMQWFMALAIKDKSLQRSVEIAGELIEKRENV